MEFLIKSITSNTNKTDREKELKKWTARLKFTVEIERKNKKLATMQAEREDIRWRNSFALMIHDSTIDKPIPEKFFLKRRNYGEKIQATTDSIEWFLNEDQRFER